MSEVGRSDTVFGVIHRPPEYNKDSVNNFSDFLAVIMPHYDRVVVVGDSNNRVLS